MFSPYYAMFPGLKGNNLDLASTKTIIQLQHCTKAWDVLVSGKQFTTNQLTLDSLGRYCDLFILKTLPNAPGNYLSFRILYIKNNNNKNFKNLKPAMKFHFNWNY